MPPDQDAPANRRAKTPSGASRSLEQGHPRREPEPEAVESPAQHTWRPGSKQGRLIETEAGSRASAPPNPRLIEELRAWRLTQARVQRMPAFRIFPDRTLNAIVQARPSSEEELLQVTGIGPRLAGKYGARILAIVASNRG